MVARPTYIELYRPIQRRIGTGAGAGALNEKVCVWGGGYRVNFAPLILRLWAN